MSKLLLIGSRALHYHLPQRAINDQTDYDFIGTQSQVMLWLATVTEEVKFETIDYPLNHIDHKSDIEKDIKYWKHMNKELGSEIYTKILSKITKISKIRGCTPTMKFEIEISQPGSSAEFILNLDEFVTLSEQPYNVGSVALLESIKTSHMIYPYNFLKHMSDLNMLRSELGRKQKYNYAPLRCDKLNELIILRRLEHYLRLGVPGSNINLNKMSDDFLENETQLYVDKYIKHDDLHLRVTIDGKAPAYDDLRIDKSKAMMSKDLFEKAPYHIKFNCVIEEASVIALERYLLPKRETDSQIAYTKAYIRICTSLTKGWFREFAINAYYLLSEVRSNIMTIRDEILQEYQMAEDLKLEQLYIEAKRENDIEMIHELSYSENYVYRVDNLLPIIFSDNPDELILAQRMGNSLSCDKDMMYRCKLPESTKELIFYGYTGYEHENMGWCCNFIEWSAYISVTTVNAGYSKNLTIRHLEPCGHVDNARIAFDMSRNLDESFQEPLSIQNLLVDHFDDIIEHSTNKLIKDKFLMKFICAILYLPKFRHGGQRAMPISNIHYLYKIWDDYMFNNSIHKNSECSDSEKSDDSDY